MKIKFNALLLSICLLLIACGGAKQMSQSENSAKVANESPCPDWFTNIPQDPDYLYAVATATSRDLSMAIDKAKQSCRTEIGAQMETRIKSLIKQFQEEIGFGEESDLSSQFTTVSKTVVSTTLSGLRVREQTTRREGTLWRACVLMEYPIGEANAQFLESLKQREILRQKAAATEAFKELEQEVEKYEQEKKMSEKNQ